MNFWESQRYPKIDDNQKIQRWPAHCRRDEMLGISVATLSIVAVSGV